MSFKRLAIATALGLVGFVINYLPVEIFPGVNLVLGSALSVLAILTTLKKRVPHSRSR